MSEKNPWLEPGEPARPTDIKSDKADLDMRLERKALAEGWDRTADKLDTALSQLAALREELAQAAHMRTFWAESAAELDKRLADAERRNADLQKDKDRLDALEANFWDVRHGSHPIADTGDSSSSLEIVGHWMDKPFERVIGEDYKENLRAAIDQAMTAPAYPPERPEYREIDAALTKPEEAKS